VKVTPLYFNEYSLWHSNLVVSTKLTSGGTNTTFLIARTANPQQTFVSPRRTVSTKTFTISTISTQTTKTIVLLRTLQEQTYPARVHRVGEGAVLSSGPERRGTGDDRPGKAGCEERLAVRRGPSALGGRVLVEEAKFYIVSVEDDPWSFTALQAAACYNSASTVNMLLELGADQDLHRKWYHPGFRQDVCSPQRGVGFAAARLL
jgi:hypothetical protein